MQKQDGKGIRHRGSWAVLAALIAGLLVGSVVRGPAGLQAQERKQKAGHFLSGGERSERILREIAATLKRLDERVGRIETHVEMAAKSAAANAESSPRRLR